jgi:hypothetical protein
MIVCCIIFVYVHLPISAYMFNYSRILQESESSSRQIRQNRMWV